MKHDCLPPPHFKNNEKRHDPAFSEKDYKEYPLPSPIWQDAPPDIDFDDIQCYLSFVQNIQQFLQQQLEQHPYNTIGNFVRFYKAFKNQDKENIENFFKNYQPIISSAHHTCVGLGLELISTIKESEFGYNNVEICNSFYIVSCEESIKDLDNYCKMEIPTKNVEKEHVAVVLGFSISGRKGYMLMDPGYHVGQVITIMADKLEPHTGWFIQSDTQKSKKEYKYEMHPNGQYIIWFNRVTREQKVNEYTSLFYVKKEFTSVIDVTERRNLVYKFKSVLKRDRNGALISGVYFKLCSDTSFTLFHQSDFGYEELKIPVKCFVTDGLGCIEKQFVSLCSSIMQLKENLFDVLVEIANILADDKFIFEVRALNSAIDANATYD